MKYLILGSAGQIGVPLCNYLRDIGHKVLTFDIVDSEFEDLRIPNNPKLNQYMEECDFVFFLAWDVGGSRYLSRYQDTHEFISNNVKIIANTFESIKKYNKPFLFASSQMANMSYSTYGITKALGEKATAALNGITAKFWNVYGPEHDLEKAHVITDFILKAKTTGVIDMMTDGTEYRQLLHATDCSRCLYSLSTKYTELSRQQEYHVSSFEWVSILEIAEVIASNFPGTTIKPAITKDSVQQDKRNEADPHILNYWKPEISLEDGIKDIIKFIGNNNEINR
jgi:nucleoside-diphosphate-sugar epimerase